MKRGGNQCYWRRRDAKPIISARQPLPSLLPKPVLKKDSKAMTTLIGVLLGEDNLYIILQMILILFAYHALSSAL